MSERRVEQYDRLYHQLHGLIVEKAPSLVAGMATICAVLHAKMRHHLWTGFYFVRGEDVLHVGPYQGPVACQVLTGGGVCLRAVRARAPVVVPDVSQVSEHVACDPRARSEIVIPCQREDRVSAVLDIDSHNPCEFTDADVLPLTRIVSLLDPWL